jgi:hypothetical protein
VEQHVKGVRVCGRDQRGALRELRDSTANLRKELQASNGAVRPPRPLTAILRNQVT